MNWDNFIPAEFEYDEANDKLANHGVTLERICSMFF